MVDHRTPSRRDDTAQGPITVAIVEDEKPYREYLQTALAGEDGIEVIGAFGDATASLKRIPRLAPEVAILDINLGGSINGIQLGLSLRNSLPEIGIVLLSNHHDPSYLTAIPREAAGGWSYLLKKAVREIGALSHAIQTAARGLMVFDPLVFEIAAKHEKQGMPRLTPRQTEILVLIAEGLTNAAIAERLAITEKTVENQINTLYQVLGINTVNAEIQPRVTAALKYLQSL